jgi:hypothetical protein
MNHIIVLFRDHGYFYDEFLRQLDKFKMKIDDVERISQHMPRDAELLEAR